MNPNLNRDAAYLRIGNRMFKPVDKDLKERQLEKEYPSINQAKLRSRELMKMGFTVVTRA